MRASVSQRHRRQFVLGALGAWAGFRGKAVVAAAEPPPEIRRVRLPATPALCVAPLFLATRLLEGEGFEDVQVVDFPATTVLGSVFAGNVLDFGLDAVGPMIAAIDRRDPIVALAGIHLGCYELFARPHIASIRDLKGRTIPIDGVGGPQHLFLASMAAYVGMDPRTDIRWEVHGSTDSVRLYESGKVDAYLGFPPEPQELRSKGIGRVIVNTAYDKPWSQYYCCMLAGRPEFVARYPNATKRVVRAILKAADLCAASPETAARMLVDGGFVKKYEFAIDALKEINYRSWRTDDPSNTLRFHAVRLHEAGMVKSAPWEIIARGANWGFVNALKSELKT